MTTEEYNQLAQDYDAFVKREQEYNQNVLDEDVKWYEDVVSPPTHFERSRFDGAAKKEMSVLKRAVILNAFEHIAAMDRAFALRDLDYADYFGRHDTSLNGDNDTMSAASSFFNVTVNKGSGQRA